ncbi:MAG: hypothetical protein A2Y10_08880 [Planctomycetes bacterium GWF2_41_51]|nr:MAG: hypothetical protein A2Y10_08880 [Planctomycetes bacterium GWF2_41_51]HBG26223.1 DUF503 domain-containing protein [Phycisphaerales bacterium]
MFTGSARICIHLQGVATLKEKRMIVKSVIGRLKSRFNVSAAEIDRLDNKQMAVLGIAVVSNDRTFTISQLDTILSFIYNDGRFYVGDVKKDVCAFDEF